MHAHIMAPATSGFRQRGHLNMVLTFLAPSRATRDLFDVHHLMPTYGETAKNRIVREFLGIQINIRADIVVPMYQTMSHNSRGARPREMSVA